MNKQDMMSGNMFVLHYLKSPRDTCGIQTLIETELQRIKVKHQ